MPSAHRDDRGRPADTGSVTPLVIGMMLCLLVLAAGITAAGSAFLAGQRAQHLCDGAAATAAGTTRTGDTPDDLQATTAAATYLATRGSNAVSSLEQQGDTLTLTCTTDSAITFGALFGSPTLHRTTTATARITYRP